MEYANQLLRALFDDNICSKCNAWDDDLVNDICAGCEGE